MSERKIRKLAFWPGWIKHWTKHTKTILCDDGHLAMIKTYTNSKHKSKIIIKTFKTRLISVTFVYDDKSYVYSNLKKTNVSKFIDNLPLIFIKVLDLF